MTQSVSKFTHPNPKKMGQAIPPKSTLKPRWASITLPSRVPEPRDWRSFQPEMEIVKKATCKLWKVSECYLAVRSLLPLEPLCEKSSRCRSKGWVTRTHSCSCSTARDRTGLPFRGCWSSTPRAGGFQIYFPEFSKKIRKFQKIQNSKIFKKNQNSEIVSNPSRIGGARNPRHNPGRTQGQICRDILRW